MVIMKTQHPKGKRRTKLKLFSGIAIVAIAGYLGAGCIAPKSLRQVKRPRSGRALNQHVAIVYSKHYQINMAGAEKLHSFDIRKYAKIYLELITEGLISPEEVFVPDAVARKDILQVHSPEFLASLNDSTTVARYLEAPVVAVAPAKLVDMGILNAFRYATGGTILAGRLALEYGIAINLGGGYHHAKPDAGAGFCIYADMPIAISVLRSEGLIQRALVVDLDVHQGDGTAICFSSDPQVFTFSMHQEHIYPIPKAKSDFDIELPSGTDDQAYLCILTQHLPGLIQRARPDIVFLQAGCDTLAGDPLATLAMTKDGIIKRDAIVLDHCVRRGIPVVMVLGGGYSQQAWAVQYASIRHTIEKYGLVDKSLHPIRRPTVKERSYTK